jgi:sortase A
MIFTTPRRSPLRAVLRFLGSVLMVSGVLLVADAGLTLLWQEPVSALLASREQRALERQLERPPARVIRRRPLRGDAIGEIELPTLDRSYFMVEGVDTASLRKGPGHYPDTPLPGERGTVAVAGHRTTYLAPFRTIDQLDRGDRVVASMPYGRFVYRVARTRIVEPTALWVKRRVRYDRLILTACHPLYSAAQRIVVFARFVRREAPTLGRRGSS